MDKVFDAIINDALSDSKDAKNVVFNIVRGGEVVGVVEDVNPIDIQTDEECELCLMAIKADLDLSPEEQELIDSCIDVVKAVIGEELHYGPAEILGLTELASKYPSKRNEILACSNHLNHSLDYDGDVPPDIYLDLFKAHATLGNVLTLNNSSLSDDSDDSDDDEPLDLGDVVLPTQS